MRAPAKRGLLEQFDAAARSRGQAVSGATRRPLAPAVSGDLIWLYGNGQYRADLTGDLTLGDANGSCARVRMNYFANGQSLTVNYGGTVCAGYGTSHTYTVDLTPAATRGSTC